MAAIVTFDDSRHRAGVTRLWREVFAAADERDLARDIDLTLRFYPRLLLVAEERGAIVGAAMGGFDGHRGWIYYLAVAAGGRRRGVGRELVGEMEKRLAAIGCPKVNLQVRGNNRGALGFYIRCGYRLEDRISFGKRLPARQHDGD